MHSCPMSERAIDRMFPPTVHDWELWFEGPISDSELGLLFALHAQVGHPLAQQPLPDMETDDSSSSSRSSDDDGAGKRKKKKKKGPQLLTKSKMQTCVCLRSGTPSFYNRFVPPIHSLIHCAILFSDMPSMKWQDIETRGSFHCSAARNKERFSSR